MNPVYLLALLLGVFLGPATAIVGEATLRALAPVAALGVGWIGAAFGARLQWRVVRRIPAPWWRVGAVHAGAAFLMVGAAVVILALAIPDLRATWRPLSSVALVLAAVAALSGPGAGARSAMLATAFGAIAFEVALALQRPTGLFLDVGGGILIGILFRGLARLSDQLHPGTMLVGVVLFGAGVGYGAGLSPFVVCAVAAAVIVNLVPERRRLVAQHLEAWQPTISCVVLVLAGAWLGLPTLWILPAAVALVAVRIAARWVVGRYGRRLLGPATPAHDPRLARVVPGAVALALGLSFLLARTPRGPGGAATAVLTMVVVGVVLTRAWHARRLTSSPVPAEVS